ncbi:MAG: tetratricopeptide repeat protein [Flavobacteriaceae bacterium]
MSYKSALFQIIIFCFSFLLAAQKTAVHQPHNKDYLTALSLFEIGSYASAQSLFDDLQQQSKNPQMASDAAYYFTVCAIRLNQQQAEQYCEHFLERYPTSPRKNTIYLDAGDYYFANAKYAYARKWYQNVLINQVPAAKKDQFYFNYGYVNYATKNFKRAKENFSKVEFSKIYGAQAKYYIGFMAYEGDDYDEATKYLNQISDQERYKNELNYFQADLNFKLGAFDKAIDVAQKALVKANKNESSELSKIIGESYFNLKNYSEAIPYLKGYKGQKGKWTNVDFYQLGYAYYKQNDFEKAIREFNKIINGNNAIAQNAYYHLGESYINLDKKQEALNAFRRASEMDFDSKIKEDAWLNYAKLSYDIGNPYLSTPQVLSEFLERYPKSPFRESIELLLVDSYVSSKNYKEALLLLESNMRNSLKPIYQKVAFYRGLELYNGTDYTQAQTLLQKAIALDIDPYITARAMYWNAEIDFLNLNFDTALYGFLNYKNNAKASTTPEYKQLNYSLGYTHFKLKQYPKAIAAFKSFVSIRSVQRSFINDALLRTADAYYVTKAYQNAIETYAKVIDTQSPMSDYATFQTAVSYGFLGQTTKKLNTLKKVLNYKNSPYLDQVYFEMANTHNTLNNTQKALETYDIVINRYIKSALVSKALLRKGLLLYNANDNQKALEVFKRVAADYPSTPEAFQSISSARSIYIDSGHVNEYAAWVGTLNYVGITDKELEKTSYEAAEKQYLDNNTNKAITLFNDYILKFPNAEQINKAQFYLASLYFKQNLKENALPHYEFVIEQPPNEFTEQALQKVCAIKLENGGEAQQVLRRLELEAKNPQNILFAQSNLMKIAYEQDDFSAALNYAQIILDNPNTDDFIKSDAQIITARCALALGNEDLARSSYAKVATSNTMDYAAEAKYYDAFFQNKDEAFAQSNELIQELIQQYPSKKLFAGKGLILMAKNYYALDDAFQATYILESVIKNFTSFEVLKTEATQLLETYERELSKSNASIESQQETKNDDEN